MHVVVSGGTGFLGRALEQVLTSRGHRVSALTRRARADRPGDIEWTPNGEVGSWANALTGADVLVNLAGEGMADARWTSTRKAALLESRLAATSSLVKAVQHIENGPRVFVSASGVGYYGPRGDEPIREDTPAGPRTSHPLRSRSAPLVAEYPYGGGNFLVLVPRNSHAPGSVAPTSKSSS